MTTEHARPTSRAPKKHLGQHFLTAPAYASRIAQSVPASPGETVVEIGPGTGALTYHLVSRFPRLICVEKDPDVVPRLREKIGPGAYQIHQADARTFDFSSLGSSMHFAGNLPYGIAAIIIRRVLTLGACVRSCTFMVQREVAERIVASPHSKRNGFLSIFCQFFGTPRILFHVPPGAFFPRPNVDSSVFQIVMGQDPAERLDPAHWEPLFELVDHGYSMRRKKLSKVLKANAGAADYEAAMARAELEPMARAEDLAVSDWIRLYREVHQC